jgi:hypothetical protein
MIGISPGYEQLFDDTRDTLLKAFEGIDEKETVFYEFLFYILVEEMANARNVGAVEGKLLLTGLVEQFLESRAMSLDDGAASARGAARVISTPKGG